LPWVPVAASIAIHHPQNKTHICRERVTAYLKHRYGKKMKIHNKLEITAEGAWGYSLNMANRLQVSKFIPVEPA